MTHLLPLSMQRNKRTPRSHSLTLETRALGLFPNVQGTFVLSSFYFPNFMRAVLKFCRHLVTAGSDITEAKCSGLVFVKNKIVVKNQTYPCFLMMKELFPCLYIFVYTQIRANKSQKQIYPGCLKNMSAMSTVLTISTLSSNPDISILNDHLFSKSV